MVFLFPNRMEPSFRCGRSELFRSSLDPSSRLHRFRAVVAAWSQPRTEQRARARFGSLAQGICSFWGIRFLFWPYKGIPTVPVEYQALQNLEAPEEAWQGSCSTVEVWDMNRGGLRLSA